MTFPLTVLRVTHRSTAAALVVALGTLPLTAQPERNAYGNGLVLEETKGFNPFRFGIVAAGDTHNGGGSFDESDYFSKIGVLNRNGQLRSSVAVDSKSEVDVYAETYYRFWGASGLAGVWADENTRLSIYEAFRPKETFGTSGPRIRVRFFGGFDLPL